MDPTASSAVETGEPEAETNSAAAPESADANQESVSDPSPEASKDDKPASVLEAVKAALKPDEAAGEPSAPSAEAESKGKAADAANAEKAGESDDEQPPFHKHPAWQRRLAKERELSGQVEALAPKAERFDAMQRMMTDAELSADEVTAGFNIMALMKSDPLKALDALRPFVDALEQYAGVQLPADLTEKVESGEMTEAAARELAQTRAARHSAESRAHRVTQSQVQDQQRRTTEAMVDAVTRWERDWQSSDPDYAKKLPLVKTQIQALRLERGQPRTVDEAVALSKEARRLVDESLKAVAPPKPPVQPNTKGASVNAQAKPKSLLDAVRNAAGMAA